MMAKLIHSHFVYSKGLPLRCTCDCIFDRTKKAERERPQDDDEVVGRRPCQNQSPECDAAGERYGMAEWWEYRRRVRE